MLIKSSSAIGFEMYGSNFELMFTKYFLKEQSEFKITSVQQEDEINT